jgi:hypothetical protein
MNRLYIEGTFVGVDGDILIIFGDRRVHFTTRLFWIIVICIKFAP